MREQLVHKELVQPEQLAQLVQPELKAMWVQLGHKELEQLGQLVL